MNVKKYDLEERTFKFANECIQLVNIVSKILVNVEIGRQLIRSAGSVAANYIEANESISSKDFYYRIKIRRKEAKESGLWLRLLDWESDLRICVADLTQESMELTTIFGSIVHRTR